MRLVIDPDRLLVNRADITLQLGLAGIQLREMWTHVLAAESRRLPNDSGYNMVCDMSYGGGQIHKGGKQLFDLIESVKKHGIQEPVTAYELTHGDAELYGGHHRAIAALVNHCKLPVVYRSLDPMSRVPHANRNGVKTAYDAVERYEDLAAGRSYNPSYGRRPIRKGYDRLKMLYHAVIDVPGKLLLDAGCNDGYFGVALLSHGFEPIFVERSGAYCDVVRAKMQALGGSADSVRNATIDDRPAGKFDVVLYTDVFYHTATKVSLPAAIAEWRSLMETTAYRMIFCPGRWDKLSAAGFTEKMMWETTRGAGFRIRYLGRDGDAGYRRPMFCLERL